MTIKPNTLGKRLGVTQKQINIIRRNETTLTKKAMQALTTGKLETFKTLIAERDTQTAWLSTYTKGA